MTDPSTPAWQTADVQSMLDALREAEEERKSYLPEALVFEYSANVAPAKGFILNRKSFDDGRHRVFLHPDWEPAVTAWLAEKAAQ